MASFPERLNLLLVEKDMNAAKLSRDTGITESLIGYWRRGEKQPGLENLEKLANYFGVSIDYLVGRVGRPYEYAHAISEREIIVTTKKEPPAPEWSKGLSEAETAAVYDKFGTVLTGEFSELMRKRFQEIIEAAIESSIDKD